MKILIATQFRAVIGGVETYLQALLPRLAARGHGLAVLIERDGETQGRAIERDVPQLPLYSMARMGREAALEAAARFGADVVYAHGLEDLSLEAALLARAPGVLFAHTFLGTCVSGKKRFAFPAVEACERTFGRACLAHYFPRRCGGLSPLTALKAYRLQAERLRLAHQYRGLLVASHFMQAEYLRHGIAQERLRVAPLFPSGIAPDPLPPPERPPGDRILFAGRLDDFKGCGTLVEAVALASAALGRPLTLEVAGEGPLRPVFEAHARRRGVRARFHGWLGLAQRNALLREVDLLAVPSQGPEPFGLVGVEAGCVGVPAVAFSAGGVPDWLEPGVTGELAPAGPLSADALAQALTRALRDPAHHHALRIGAWRASHRFTPEAHLDVLEAALGQARA